MRTAAALFLALVSTAAALSPTALGAFLAGRKLPATSALAPLQESEEYKEHARLYASQWFSYEDNC